MRVQPVYKMLEKQDYIKSGFIILIFEELLDFLVLVGCDGSKNHGSEEIAFLWICY